MIGFRPEDHIPMEEFEFKHLFFDDPPFPVEAIQQIKPLNPEAAAPKLEPYWDCVVKWGGALAPDRFKGDIQITDAESAATWLTKLGIPDNQRIYVSWSDGPFYVETRWTIFRNYWQDFVSVPEDLLVIPAEEDWLLYWFHHDEFQFGYLA